MSNQALEVSPEAVRSGDGRERHRLLVIASHVIQYQTPMYRRLAADPRLDLTVAFCSDWGLKSYRDSGFDREISWDTQLLGGFNAQFLSNWSPRPNPSRFWGLVNPDVLALIRRQRFDAVWVHGWASLTNWMAMLTCFAAGVPVLVRGETNLLPPLPAWKRIAKQILLGRLFRRLSAALAIGRHNGEFYKAYGLSEAKIFPVPYAVDNLYFRDRLTLLPPKEQLRR